jgi:hypothetical protein
MFQNARAWLARQLDQLCGHESQMDGEDGSWNTRRTPILQQQAWPGERIGRRNGTTRSPPL